MMAISGSEPGSSRSSSRKVRSGAYSGPEARERHAPGLFTLRQPQGVVVGGHGRDAGLWVAGGDLAPYHLVVQAAGQKGDAARVPGQFQGEGFGDGDGGQQVLHPQQGALAAAGRRDGQEDRRLLPVAAQEDAPDADTHDLCLLVVEMVVSRDRQPAVPGAFATVRVWEGRGENPMPYKGGRRRPPL